MSDLQQAGKAGRSTPPPVPRSSSGGGSSAVKAWLLAVVAIIGCGGLGYFYMKLRGRHIEQKGRLDAAEKLALRQPGDQARADKAEGELATLKTTYAALETAKNKLEEAQKFTAVELAQLREMKRAADERTAAFEKLKGEFKEMIDNKVLEVERREGRLIVRLPAEVLFPLGSAELSEKGQIELYKLSAILQKQQLTSKFRYMIGGHTDDTPIQPGPATKYRDNWDLSTARAVTVTQLLIKAGIPPKTLVAAGYGEFDPIAENSSEPNRARNRRIEIVLLPEVDDVALLSGDEPKPGN
jgi:chemotaxis protein MotB